MKEIIYNNFSDFAEIVAQGEYKGLKYIVVNRGYHPCAYVICEYLMKDRDDSILDELNVHGGVTYFGHLDRLQGLTSHMDGHKIAFGWDYGHAGDWCGYNNPEINKIMQCKKWDTQTIVQHCKDAIDQFLKIAIKKKDNYIQDEDLPVMRAFAKGYEQGMRDAFKKMETFIKNQK